MTNIFEQGTRQGLRFDCPERCQQNGVMTIEHLWKIPMTKALRNAVTLKALHEDVIGKLALQPDTESSLFKVAVSENKVVKKLQLQLEIIEHIAKTRMAEEEADNKRKAAAERNKRTASVERELLEKRLLEIKGKLMSDMTEAEVLAKLQDLE